MTINPLVPARNFEKGISMTQLSDDDILILQGLVSRLRGMTDPFHVAFPFDDDHPTDEQYYVDVRFEKKSL